ncbi:small-conductance mechanosensitive channel [Flavobacterium gossypii]|uniref:Small-conductance mechanosensitive channel n=1 Tax=Flavobacterium gossypii TaxID=1646119 RepID=A0ABR6DS07_9FLAO|nr:mechanosensitive ion channel family protein [Flavobacterium gossypii]MBA9074239.1 small-conductance mechanosensitive channel [Flavobacterium gossypii]
MEEFINDVMHHIEGYYKSIVAITPKILLATAILLVSWLIASRISVFAGRRLKSKMQDSLLATFISNLIKAILIAIGLLFMFRIVGLTGVAQTVLAGAGITAFVIGFALKDIGENFLAGILLAFKRPFSVGDIIESNGVKGKVVTLNLRDTQIRSDSKDIYIPNALLIKSILTNFNSGGFLLQDFMIGIEYGSDYKRAISLIKEVLERHDKVVDQDYHNSAVVAGVTGAIVQLTVRYWVKTDPSISDGKTRSEIIIEIMEILKQHDYVIK